ncbi:MAG: ABC transporter permease [Elusimicrobia bacterium]|nr:ABC transporter permease [Elusimicrobiota bacterium]
MVIISISGVALGVAALVVTLSVMNGFHSEITSKLLSLNPHIVITDMYGGRTDRDKLSAQLNNTAGVKSFSPFIYGRGLIQKGNASNGVVLKGIKPGTSRLSLSEGKWKDLAGDSIVIGKELAGMLGLRLGDTAFVIIPRVENITSPVIPRIKKVTVAGVFNSGMYEYDSGLVYLNIQTAGDIIPSDIATSGTEVYLDNPFNAESVSAGLSEKIGYYSLNTWQSRNRNLFAALKLEKAMMFIVLIMIVIIATFNIAGSLIMVAVTRSRDCGIMRAVGATKRQIRMLFHFKGLMIGFCGTILGTIIGLGLAYIVEKYEIIKLPPHVYLISRVPVSVNFTDIAIVGITAMVISYLATIYPSRRAGRIEIARELSYE